MKYIIYVNNESVAKRIKSTLKEVLKSAKIDIVDNCMDCFTKGVTYNYAFISDNNEGMPWMNLMFHLAAQGVGVYFVADVIDKEIIKSIKEASGLSAINSQNIEQEIQSMFTGMAVDDDGDEGQESSEEDRDKESSDTNNSVINIQDYALLRSRKYPAVIVSVHGGRGGVGKTSISANIAVMLAKMGFRTIAVDFDIENGNLFGVLHMNTDKDLKDVIKGNFQYTDTSFEQHPSGLFLLPSLKIPAESELITAEVSERIIGRLARAFEVIVIDTGSLEIDPMLVAMQVSTKTYVVTTYDMTVVAKTYSLLEDARMLGVDTSKIKLVVNRKLKKSSIKKSDISEHISQPILVEIEEDEGVQASVNDGEVPVENGGSELFKNSIRAIVEDIIKDTALSSKQIENEESPEIPKKRGLLSRWKG